MKTIYELELHETMLIRETGEGFLIDWKVTRVASGWIYRRIGGEGALFIPFDIEFHLEK